MKAGSFYSGGVDGFAYAAKQLGIETVWHVENNKKAWKYLRKNYGDGFKLYTHDECLGTDIEWVEIIFGGDPCQPHSSSGKRGGKDDNRYRWPYMFKGIKQLRPNWVINENVAGSISNLVLDQKITDLESIGYACQTYDIPAVSVNAHHTRRRVWLVAHSNGQGRSELLCPNPSTIIKESGQEYTLGAQGNAFLQFEERVRQPAILPIPDGIPDHIFRLEAAGQAIVPQIPLIILTFIKWIHENYNL